jgi:hypothetical protein
MWIRICDPGSCQPGILDGKSRIQYNYKHPGSATLAEEFLHKYSLPLGKQIR